MREYNFHIVDPLRNGLRPDARMPLNAPYMTVMTNMKPTEYGAATYERPAYPITVPILSVSWPWPALFRGHRTTLLCDETAIYTVASDWTTTALTTYDSLTPASTKAITSGDLWQHVSFHDLWILTNGTSLVWDLPSNSGTKIYTYNAGYIKAIAQHGYRLFLGGVQSIPSDVENHRWSDLTQAWMETLGDDRFAHEDMVIDDTFVIWSERGGGADDVPFYAILTAIQCHGGTAFDALRPALIHLFEQGEIGMVPMRTPGLIRMMKPLGDAMVVYGAQGISLLVPQENGYREQLLLATGVPSRGAAAGDELEHHFICNDGYLWRIRSGEWVPTRLGYSEQLSTMTAASIVGSFDPIERDFWFADGTYAYVVSKTGLGGPMNVLPTNLFRDPTQGLVGVADGLGIESMAIQLESGVFDISERGSKHVTTLQVADTNLEDRRARMLTRRRSNDAFAATSWIPINTEGAGFPSSSFVEGKLAYKANVTDQNTVATVTRLEVRYNAEDVRYRRGTAGVPETA